MPSNDALKIGIWGSIGIHLVALLLLGGGKELPVSGNDFIRISAESLDAVVAGEAGGVAIGSIGPQNTSEQKLAEERRRVYLQYLDDVSSEIHSRRLDFGHTDLIGIAICTFFIDETGRFVSVRLLKSSGHPELDRVAMMAVEAASGRVKRPKILGNSRIGVAQEVRFQYGLK